MTDKRTLQEILTELTINKNLKEPSNIAYHGTGARFYQYDPSFALTGEGANKYGRGFYSGSIPEIGEFYKSLADSQGKQGTVYRVNLPEQYKYYNTDLPLAQQSDWVREKLAANVNPVDIFEYNHDLSQTHRFDNLYDDFLKATGRKPKYTNEILEFINQHPERYAKEIFNPMDASSGKYSQLNRTLKDLGIVGTTHYKPNGANVNITFNPKDIDIIQPYEVGPRMTAKAADVNKTLNELLKGYRRAFNPINKTVLQNPYTKPALKALGTVAGPIGFVGDVMMVNDLVNWYEKNALENWGMTPQDLRRLYKGSPVLYGYRALRDAKSQGLDKVLQEDFPYLPAIHINEDNTANVTLQGGVNYDDYMLEPLGDDIYMRRIPDGGLNN